MAGAGTGLDPDGAILVRRSQDPEKPWYLQRVVNAWEESRYYGRHEIICEDFATREEAEARAEELRRG